MRTIAVALCAVTVAWIVSPVSAQTCAWTHWAAPWGAYNLGPDQNPPNGHFPATNWDYTFSQDTVLNTPKTTPTGGGDFALHWFLDAQPPATTSNGSGSGGVYQEIEVTPGVPISYSFWWRGASGSNTAWFEFMLIDGPFSIAAADTSADPNIMRKRENTTWNWEFLDDQTPLHLGPGGPTITPTGSIVTVVLKAGRSPAGAMEAFFDNVEVWQGAGPNLIVNGDFEDADQGAICDDQLVFQDPGQNNYWFSVPPPTCDFQHTVSGVDPTSTPNDTDITLTLTGTDLELISEARLVPVGGGTPIVGTNLTTGPGPGETSLMVDFATTGAQTGMYHLQTDQPAPCLPQQLSNAFEVTCFAPVNLTGVSPSGQTDPDVPVELTISGQNVDLLSSVSLQLGTSSAVIPGTGLTLDGPDLRATFDLSCAPSGTYRLIGSRTDGCAAPTPLPNAFTLRKTPVTPSCVWRPWAAPFSKLNLSDDIDPPNEIFDATNWDYSFSQATVLDMPQDTPPGGGARAFHWFLDEQPPEVISDGFGSGGIYQEIAVTPGVPLEYAYYWKGKGADSVSWFEFVLIDGPFSGYDADGFQESGDANNPAIIRKRELTNSSFDWEQRTHLDPADAGPAGPRPTTITPTGNVATVVLKAGRTPMGVERGMEAFFDSVVVTQNGGPNLLINGDFENNNQAVICDAEAIFADSCELNYWMGAAFFAEPPLLCNEPFADADGDGDVDQADFAILQRCLTGDAGGHPPIPEDPEYCACFDRNADGAIGSFDLTEFINCFTGPDILHANDPNPNCSEQP